MVFAKEYQKKSGLSEGNITNEIGMNVVIDDGVFQGTCDISQVKQEQRQLLYLKDDNFFSELDSIIMEGDIILKVHADGEIDYSSQKEYQAMTGECAGHEILYELQDDMLVKVGDTFQSNKDFVKYVNDHATRWCFSYKCTGVENADTENETYTYCCVYLKNRDYTKKKGGKKRNNCRTDCPCKVKLRRKPGEDLTVEFVCNHHDHELSEEDYNKFQKNNKLPPYIKEIIMDLLALEVEISKIRKFIEMETGMKLCRSYFHEIERKMRLKHEERQITDKRLKELSDKMSVVDEMFSGDDDDNSDDQSPPTKSKRIKLTGPDGIICKFEEDETSSNNFEATTNSDTQSYWPKDQSNVVSVSRTSASEWDEGTAATIDDKQDSQDYADHTADDYNHEYTVEEIPQETTNNTENTTNNFSQFETVVLQDEFGNIINCENDEQIVILQQDENGMVQGENGTIGYFDGEQFIYMTDPNQQTEQVESNEGNESSTACDTAVQTSDIAKPGHSFVPVFDICMKNGNVTGFVVNENVAKENPGWKGAGNNAKKLLDPVPNTSQLSEMESAPEDQSNISTSNATQEFVNGDTYTKNEYIHRYNIDQYMANPQFPKYIDTLAKKTRVDVMQMLAKVYSEKAMFKMTTTQKGKEGNTKIWYLTDVRRKGKYKMSDEEKMKRDKIGQYLTDILILKERCKHLKRENEELITRNKYLEEVALRLAKMHEHN